MPYLPEQDWSDWERVPDLPEQDWSDWEGCLICMSRIFGPAQKIRRSGKLPNFFNVYVRRMIVNTTCNPLNFLWAPFLLRRLLIWWITTSKTVENQAAARSARQLPNQNQAAACLVRLLPDQNRQLPDQNQAGTWSIRQPPDWSDSF